MLLILDQANYFSFTVDDLETKLSHINWMPLATGSGAYSLKNAYDQEVLTYMTTEVDAGNILGTDIAPVDLTGAGGPDAMLDTINTLNTRLSLQDVPEENRWLVLSPSMLEKLMSVDSKLINADYNGGAMDLKNGLVSTMKLRGFNVHMTNNAPEGATNPIMLAGHMSSTATASAITKTENIRDPRTFADIVRGLHVYGRQVIRPEAMAMAHVSL